MIRVGFWKLWKYTPLKTKEQEDDIVAKLSCHECQNKTNGFFQGRIQEFVQWELKFSFSFQGDSAPVGAWKPSEINKCPGGLSPHSPP